MAKQIHVVRHGKNWAAKQNNAQRASAVAPTQREAFERAREIAKNQGISELGLEIRDQRIISSGRLCPSDAMNQIRRALSDLP